MQGMSERQYAAHVGLSRGAIQKAKAAERLDGAPLQRSELTGKDGAALPSGINVTFVQPGGG